MLENWGLMTKAQDDSTTIDEAIASAISAHEADPDAHLGVDESLETHRANEIVDHKAGSVLADKWTMSEFEFTTTFDNLAGFFCAGDTESYWPGVMISTSGVTAPHKSSVQADLESAGFMFDTSKEMLMQFIFNGDNDTNALMSIFLGTSYADDYTRGMGLEIIGSTARFFAGNEAGTTLDYLSWPTYESGIAYVIRMQNVPAEGVIKVFINGELLGTLEWPEQWDSNMTWKSYLADTTGTGNYVKIHSLFLSIEP